MAEDKLYTRDELKSIIRDKFKHRATRIRKAVEDQKKRSAIYSPKIVENDPFIGKYDNADANTGLSLIQPRFPFHILKGIVENSDVTLALIDAMKKNIEGFGFGMRFLGDDIVANETKNQANKVMLEDFFNYANEAESFVTITGKKRHDMEYFGCGAVEIQRTESNEIAAAYHIPMELVRGTTYEKDPIDIVCNIRRRGAVVPVKFKKYFRRFAQMGYDGTIQRFFKEYGDPRSIEAKTGKVVPGLPKEEQATELYIDTIFAGNYLYGLPRWMGIIMDVLGRRNAQHVNWDLFESQGIPRMVVMVSGGTLTEESYAALEDLLLEAQGIANYNKVTLLEANSDSLGIDDRANTARIDFKNLSEARQDDQMFTRYLEQTEKSIRGAFRLPPLYLGGVSEYCHFEDTETLTEHGWRLYTDIPEGTKIAVIDPETRELTFEVPEALHVFPRKERELYHFNAQAADFLVTGEHGMYVAQPAIRKNASPLNWGREQAQDIYNLNKPRTRKNYLCAPEMFQGAGVPSDIPIPDSELFLTFIGYVIADGHIRKNPDCESHKTIRFSVKKPRKKSEYTTVCKFLENYGIKVKIYTEMSRKGYIQIDVTDDALWSYCSKHLLTPTREKKLPEWALNLDSNDAQILLDALIFGDGGFAYQGPNSCYYSTTSEILADQVQLLAFFAGKRARKIGYVDSRPNRKKCFMITIANSLTTEVRTEQITKEKHYGAVYCFHVNNRLFVTRRNGKIGISFNTLATARAAALVAESQVFIPERLLSDEKVNRKIIQNGFNIHDWSYYNKTIRITGAEEIATVVKSFAKTGAFTINHAISQANEAFGLTMSQFKEDWANYPYDIVMELLRTNRLKGLDSIAEKAVQENAKKVEEFKDTNGIKEIDNLHTNDTKEKMEALRHLVKPSEFTLYKTIETLRTALNIISKEEDQFNINEG